MEGAGRRRGSPVAPTRGRDLAQPEQVRSAFSHVDPQSLDPKKIHRFILGVDNDVREMSKQEVAKELNDPFAKLFLRKGTFPKTIDEIVAGVKTATGANSPLRRQMSFL